jgi:hypothetical protein
MLMVRRRSKVIEQVINLRRREVGCEVRWWMVLAITIPIETDFFEKAIVAQLVNKIVLTRKYLGSVWSAMGISIFIVV